jgi:hypothetical protein
MYICVYKGLIPRLQAIQRADICISAYKGLIPRALFLGEMRNISHEMKSCMRSKDKLGFARKNFASPVSRSPFYSLRKRKKSANSIESLMCSHPSYFGISHTRFRAKMYVSGYNRFPLSSGHASRVLQAVRQAHRLFISKNYIIGEEITGIFFKILTMETVWILVENSIGKSNQFHIY